MDVSMLRCKIHRATVTDADLDYEGSIEIDSNLMEAAGLLEFERVDIYNITNGNRFSTYAIEGAPGSGTICTNGAAAHLAKTGDKIIIAAYGTLDMEQARSHKPVIVLVDEKNGIKEVH